ncbi:MAG: hypothetical protein WAM60_05275, partial [Candidatus Promineifilaceae bacterium]
MNSNELLTNDICLPPPPQEAAAAVSSPGLPVQQGLYDPRYEHDACGIGFVVNVQGNKSHQIIRQALTVLKNLSHRGATGAEVNTGDGAGILLQIPHTFLEIKCAEEGFHLPSAGNYG